ncbi:MAG: hypothetical protein AVDCRST_MAG19-1170, partial [uncultured Thermomicrobiales bacterium]
DREVVLRRRPASGLRWHDRGATRDTPVTHRGPRV